MNNKQNQKIMQITSETIVVGVDIGSEENYARAFDYRGIELSKKVFRFSNDDNGFANFSNWMIYLMNENKKNAVMVGMEPTGHYWLNVGHYLKENQVKLVLVNPFHVKRSKEFDDNSPTKNDMKDPKTIAMLVNEGRYMEPYIPEGIYNELRVAVEIKDQITKQLVIVKNRIARWISIYFPEFNKVFADWEGKAALMTLKSFPMPAEIVKLTGEEIVVCWREEVKRAVGIKKSNKLIEAAKKSVGVSEGLELAKMELEVLLAQYDLYQKQLDKTLGKIDEMTIKIPGMNEILDIKGIGLTTVAGFISEVGDIERFEHPRQIQKLAGFNIQENSSGKHKGQTTISKRGRKKLRSILFQAILPVVANNKEFQELHKYYITRTVNPLKKKQSLILLCCKLIRIFYVILKKKVKYDPQKMMNDINRPQCDVAC